MGKAAMKSANDAEPQDQTDDSYYCDHADDSHSDR